jgi:hypothetical protein
MSVLRKTDLVQHAKQKNTWELLIKQERGDNVKTTRTPPNGSLRPVAYLSIGGSNYGLVIIDDFSCFTWVFFLQDKSETQSTLKRFLRRA